MRDKYHRKGLVLGIILLVIGTSVVPSTIGYFETSHQINVVNNNGDEHTETIREQETISIQIEEIIQMPWHYDVCSIDLVITMQDSPLSLLYRDFLNLTGDVPEYDAQEIEETVTFSDTFTPGPNVSYQENYVTPSVVPVRQELLNGVIEEHYLSLGLEIFEVYSATMWGIGNDCVINISADAYFYTTRGSDAFIGPTDVDKSFDRAAFLFEKIGFIQEMLNSSDFTGFQQYISTWNTIFKFDYQITNPEELEETWYQDFGNGTSLSATVTVTTPYKCSLTEEMIVNKSEITVTPEELLEDEFLCFKTFWMKWGVQKGKTTMNPIQEALAHPQKRGIGKGARGYKGIGWSIDLLDEEFSLPIVEGDYFTATLNIHDVITLSGHVGWEFKWFKLKKFKTWTQVSATMDMTLDITATYEYTGGYEELLFARERTYFRMVGYIPVEYTLSFSGTFHFNVTIEGEMSVSYPANVNGSIKAGVGWKKGKGWHRIFDTDFDVEVDDPSWNADADITIKPYISFCLTILFYETVGPFVELVPYAELEIYPLNQPGDQWYFEVGVDLNAGIDFSKWVKKIFKLNGHEWTLFHYVIWDCWECQAPYNYDIKASDIASQKKAFITEPVDITVNLINKGDTEVDATVELTYDSNYGSGTIGTEFVNDFIRGEMRTVLFVWDTTTLATEPENYTLTAVATIQGHDDGNLSDNQVSDWIYFEVQNVHVTDVIVDEDIVIEGIPVHFNVTAVNEGSATIPALPVFGYYQQEGYDKQLISDVWCECIDMVFDLPPYIGNTEEFDFTWDTWGDAEDDEYTILGEAKLLPFELDEEDNLKESDTTVTVIVSADAPTTPEIPQGATALGIDEEAEYSTVSYDPDLDWIFYKWDWGNEVSQWIGPYPSGQMVTEIHAWDAPGDYYVRAKAKNLLLGFSSPWSEPLYVTVGTIGDINGDGHVDVIDLLMLLAAWGPCGGCPEDINDDGTVDILDLLILLANWTI